MDEATLRAISAKEGEASKRSCDPAVETSDHLVNG
jgi:hypothetical protein